MLVHTQTVFHPAKQSPATARPFFPSFGWRNWSAPVTHRDQGRCRCSGMCPWLSSSPRKTLVPSRCPWG